MKFLAGGCEVAWLGLCNELSPTWGGGINDLGPGNQSAEEDMRTGMRMSPEAGSDQ